jgi:hypothetical protein
LEDYSVKAFAVGGLIACLLSLPAWADCTAPQPPPHPPDGATASREEMLSAMQAIRGYEASVKEFQDCASRTSNAFDKRVANLAIDKLVVIADQFNNELNAFKKKSSQ